jgi:hypothetical protein
MLVKYVRAASSCDWSRAARTRSPDAAAAPASFQRVRRKPGRHRLRLPLRLDRLRLAVVDHLARGTVGGLADEDPVRRRSRLQARRRVDDVAGDDRVAARRIGVERDERLARGR